MGPVPISSIKRAATVFSRSSWLPHMKRLLLHTPLERFGGLRPLDKLYTFTPRPLVPGAPDGDVGDGVLCKEVDGHNCLPQPEILP